MHHIGRATEKCVFFGGCQWLLEAAEVKNTLHQKPIVIVLVASRSSQFPVVFFAKIVPK